MLSEKIDPDWWKQWGEGRDGTDPAPVAEMAQTLAEGFLASPFATGKPVFDVRFRAYLASINVAVIGDRQFELLADAAFRHFEAVHRGRRVVTRPVR